MSISRKIPAGNFVDYAEHNPATVTGRRPVVHGNKPVGKLTVGNFVLSSDNTYNKVTAINEINDVAIKLLTSEGGLTMKIASESSVNIGDIISGPSAVTHRVKSLEDSGTSKCFELTIEGGKDFIVNGVVV